MVLLLQVADDVDAMLCKPREHLSKQKPLGHGNLWALASHLIHQVLLPLKVPNQDLQGKIPSLVTVVRYYQGYSYIELMETKPEVSEAVSSISNKFSYPRDYPTTPTFNVGPPVGSCHRKSVIPFWTKGIHFLFEYDENQLSSVIYEPWLT